MATTEKAQFLVVVLQASLGVATCSNEAWEEQVARVDDLKVRCSFYGSQVLKDDVSAFSKQ